MLCRVAEVSRKCYYNHLKSPKGIEDAEILKEIRFQQEKDYNSIGYREMTRLVSKKIGKKVNCKRILHLMQKHDLLSAVRRKKYSDEVYIKRRELKAQVPPDFSLLWNQ